LSTRTQWLDTLKKSVEKQSKETHNSAARASARSVNAFSKTLAQHTDKTDKGPASRDEPLEREALLDLLENEREWWSFFKLCCERSSRLTVQAWQFREELRDQRHHFQTEVVEVTLLGLACDLLPESAAAVWDVEWAHELCKDALSRLAVTYDALSTEEKDALDLSAQHEWDEQMATASLGKDPVALRAALEGWEQAGLDAMNRAREKGALRETQEPPA
jgi:hypothetical protein